MGTYDEALEREEQLHKLFMDTLAEHGLRGRLHTHETECPNGGGYTHKLWFSEVYLSNLPFNLYLNIQLANDLVLVFSTFAATTLDEILNDGEFAIQEMPIPDVLGEPMVQSFAHAAKHYEEKED